MNFRMVLEKIISSFEKEGIQYALIGGFAAGLWGAGRSTVDIDMLIPLDQTAKVDAVMSGLGYECAFKSENVSQYLSPLNVFGEVDFLHAFRKASREMLTRAVKKSIFDDTIEIKVLIPEDLIGLKLQAIKNNPSREPTDIADMESLLLVNKAKIDWQLLESYFMTFEMEDLYRKLREGSRS